jgi:heme o synthase
VIRSWLQLTKPGIVLGNLISASGGFLLAARGHIDAARFAAVFLGIALVVAAGGVCNNVVDRDIDAMMARTRHRAMALGLIAPAPALRYAALLGLAGLALLAAINILTALLALFGLLVYVGLYSLLLKRRSMHGTLVGSLSGAVPPLVGYCAVAGRVDAGALLLLLMFALWQMPHSYAIAIFRAEDYAAAGIPVPPLTLGTAAAKRHIAYYIVAFTLTAMLLTAAGYTGDAYLAVALLAGLYWFALALSGGHTLDDRGWARRVFACSLYTIVVLSVMMSVDFAAGTPLY